MDLKPHERIIVALDGISDADTLLDTAQELRDAVGMVKVNDALDRYGTSVIGVLRSIGVHVFADPKLHDIPNTMANRMKTYRVADTSFVTVHASATVDGMRAAVEASGDMKVLAVTVLTSMSEDECRWVYGDPMRDTFPRYGFGFSRGEYGHLVGKVLQFAHDAATAGVHGIVCSPQELKFLQHHNYPVPDIKVTPGIRPQWAAAGDQKRITTPAEAILMGADYLVIGRPITCPPGGMTPVEAADRIAEEIASVS